MLAQSVALALVLSAPGPAPYSLTISPAKMPESHHTISAYNGGTRAEQVAAYATEIKRVNGQCRITGQPVSWASVQPSAFNLAPHKWQHAHVLVAKHAPAGHTDLALVFRVLPGSHGVVRVSDAAAAQMLVIRPGKSAGRPCIALSTPQHASPVLAYALSALVVLLALMGLWAFVLRRRRYHGAHR